MVSNGDRGGLVLSHVGCVGQAGCDLCGSGFWVGGWRWVDFNRYDFGGQQRGSSGAMTWVVGATTWVWFLTVGCGVFFFFFFLC